MRYCGICFVVTVLVQISIGELILIRKQDDVYCMESKYSNKALTWIPTIVWKKRLTYEEEVSWLPANRERAGFLHLNCDLMREGGCPLANEFKKSWEIIDNASDDYGFILDHRWHSLPLYTTSGAPLELVRIPITDPNENTHIYMSILAKNNAIITLTDGEKGFSIKIDVYMQTEIGKRRSISYCYEDGLGIPKCYNALNDEIIYTVGSTLNDGEEWKNVKLVIHRNETRELFITIGEDCFWHILPYAYKGRNYRIGQVTNLFVTTAGDQRGFWKFHHYKALRPRHPGSAIYLDFDTSRNPKLCLSILYHSGGLNEQDTAAATLRIYDASESKTETSYELQAGLDWQEFRHIFNLQINTLYHFILTPSETYPIFAIGEIRVCNEKEYLVNKMKYKQKGDNVTCSTLNGDTKISLRQLDQQRSSYVCPKGSFGENCDIQCSHVVDSCEGVQVCNVEVCSCLSGYNGEHCEDECHGNSGNKCQIQCLHCRNGMECDVLNGSCPNSECEDGYYPGNNSFCLEKCQRGTYGYNCKQNCSAFCSIPHECDHVNGACTRDKCNPEVYVPPTCKYPRFRLTEPPQVLKLGMDNIELNIPLKGITADTDIFKFIKQIAVQYRLHQTHSQSTAYWQEGDRLPFLDLYGEMPGQITLSGLTSHTTYDIRVILYDENGNGNDGNQVPILFDVTTLSKPTDNPSNTSSTVIIILLVCVICAALLGIVIIVICIIMKKSKKNRATATAVVDDVLYDEIDLNEAVPLPAPEPPPRVRDAHGYLAVLEPYQYDVVREPQPLQPWIKRLRFGRRNVDREGYEMPVNRRNIT